MRAAALTLAVLLSFASTAFADETSHRQAVEKLLGAMKMESSLKTGIDKMMEIQLQSAPQLAPFKDTVRAFFDKHMSWSALKPMYVQLYMDSFTESEIKDMITFFNTPTGKKAAAVLPELGVKGAELGAKVMKEHMGELMSLLREAAEKQKGK
jgi:hypothetical protein